MSRLVIINGDDFGFSKGVNQAIIQAYEYGVLTSTSLMVNGEAATEAIALAQSHSNLAVGLHLVLVCGQSVLPPEQIPHLVDKHGCFSDSPFKAGLTYQFHPQAREELYLEIRAQLQKFRDSGLLLSHVDGHLHLHTHPVVLHILTQLAPEFDIRVIRLPSEELGLNLWLDRRNLATKLVWSLVFGRLRSYGESLLSSRGIKFADRVYGLLQTGNVTEAYLLGLIPQIKADLVEIYAHPAISNHEEILHSQLDSGELELRGLLSQQVREVLLTYGFSLTNYQKIVK